jgi:hypothetical protein
MDDIRMIIKAICELSTHRNAWSWSQLANKALGNGSRSEEIGRILSSNPRYWRKAPGMYMVTFDWEKIIKDGLLPPARDYQFLKLCRAVEAAGLAGEVLDYHRLAEIRFGDDTDLSRKKIAQMVVAHRCYIEMPVAARVRFRWDLIRMPPTAPCDDLPLPTPQDDLVTNLLKALRHEARDSAKGARKNPQVVTGLERLTSKAVSGYCYKGDLKDREDEDPIILLEGMPVQVEWSPNIVVEAVLLVHDLKEMQVVLEFKQPQIGTTCKIYPDTARLLKGYRLFVERLRRNRLALEVLEQGGALKAPFDGTLHVDALRPGQEAIVRSALTNDVLFIWGPPGTGKTYTLAATIAEMALRGERILATSISNRAVDELAQDIYERLQKSERGRALLANRGVLRLGFAGTEILEHDELFPHRAELQRIRQDIIRVKKERDACTDVEAKAGLQQKLTALQEHLGRIVKDSLGHARVVLTTVAQVALIKEFKACDPDSKDAEKTTYPFDTVVCDEASMMNATHLIPICWWGTKRIIIAGDHKQLGPVVVSKSKLSLEHLHKSLFELELRRPERQRRMLQLTQQSRMHESICSLVSGPFYRGKLETIDWSSSTTTPPLMLPGRMRAGLMFVRQSETRRTKRDSRMNPVEAGIVLDLLKVLLNYKEDTYRRIGVVTAYRAQAGHLRQLLKSHGLEKEKRVQVGTVHAFQGGEAEVIIWNLVDSRNLVRPNGSVDSKRRGKPGRLFWDITGERLLNVAISRSKCAVYVVGDIDMFLEESPNRAMRDILWRIRDEGHTWETSALRRNHG